MTEFSHHSAIEIAPGVRRITASNPSAMTGAGTNSYLLGVSALIVIDPGPDDPSHRDALLSASKGRLRYIVVTHRHPDHAPGARRLSEQSGAIVLSYDVEGAAHPDAALADGDTVAVPGLGLRVLHTPGHSPDHCCFLLEPDRNDGSIPRLLFSGDHILGGTTVAISPPDGDMAVYLASLRRLGELSSQIDAIAPGHGGVIESPRAVIDEYLAHRSDRERQILGLLFDLGPSSPAALAKVIYRDYPEGVQRAARSQVWAHLRKLVGDGAVKTNSFDDLDGIWELVND